MARRWRRGGGYRTGDGKAGLKLNWEKFDMITDTVFLEKGLKVTFDVGLDSIMAKKVGMTNLFMDLDSKSSSEKYGFLGDIPGVVEWVGDKKCGFVKDYGYTIANRDFYTAIDIDRNEIEDDGLGRLKQKCDSLVAAVGGWKESLLTEMLNNSLTSLAYDGVPFFANAGGARVTDNLLSGSGVDTILHIITDIAAARAAMRKFVSDQGRVLSLEMDTIVCSDELEFLMDQATAPTYTDGSGNLQQNPVAKWVKNVVYLPGLTDTDDWFAFCTGFFLKPLVFQTRQNPTPVLDDTAVKRNKKLVYSVEMRGNTGWTLPILGTRTVNT
jgi:phage major head subunit gpT-like protein